MPTVKVRDWKPGEIIRIEGTEVSFEDPSMANLLAGVVEGVRRKFGDRLITVDVRMQVDAQVVVGTMSLPPVAVRGESGR